MRESEDGKEEADRWGGCRSSDKKEKRKKWGRKLGWLALGTGFWGPQH